MDAGISISASNQTIKRKALKGPSSDFVFAEPSRLCFPSGPVVVVPRGGGVGGGEFCLGPPGTDVNVHQAGNTKLAGMTRSGPGGCLGVCESDAATRADILCAQQWASSRRARPLQTQVEGVVDQLLWACCPAQTLMVFLDGYSCS